MALTAAHEMFDRDTASKSLGIELLDAGNGQAAEFRGRSRTIGAGGAA